MKDSIGNFFWWRKFFRASFVNDKKWRFACINNRVLFCCNNCSLLEQFSLCWARVEQSWHVYEVRIFLNPFLHPSPFLWMVKIFLHCLSLSNEATIQVKELIKFNYKTTKRKLYKLSFLFRAFSVTSSWRLKSCKKRRNKNEFLKDKYNNNKNIKTRLIFLLDLYTFWDSILSFFELW